MSWPHIHAYGDQCPDAKGIIHLGATSAFVTDNGDLLQMQEGLSLLLSKIKKLIGILKNLAKKTADIPTLGFTHLTTSTAYNCWQENLSLAPRHPF